MGVYVLFICLEQDEVIEFGAKGGECLEKGYYMYVGSDPYKDFSRLQRHEDLSESSENDTTHWHIDYLLQSENSVIQSSWTSQSHQECEVATSISNLDNVFETGSLGASDCKCTTHLFYTNTDSIEEIAHQAL